MAREKGYSAFLKKAIYIFERQIYFNYQTCIIKRASSTADASHAAACAVYKKLKLIKKFYIPILCIYWHAVLPSPSDPRASLERKKKVKRFLPQLSVFV